MWPIDTSSPNRSEREDLHTTVTVSVAAASTSGTAAPSSAPAAEEIIPGFPRPDDLAGFLSVLQHEPALVGAAGTELAAELDRLLLEHSVRKQRDQARSLTDLVGTWVAAGQLDAAIAGALTELLAPLAAKSKS